MPFAFVAIFTSLTAASFASEASVYTLYRNSLTNVNMRLHVATFDSSEGDSYNRENCELAASLFQSQAGVKTKFWCEKGRFKK